MQSRSIQRAFRAAIRSLFCLGLTVGVAQAAGELPNYSLPLSCVVHDSGWEFLPKILRDCPAAPIDTHVEAASAEAEASDSHLSDRIPMDPVEDCAILASRFDRCQELLSSIHEFHRWTKQQTRIALASSAGWHLGIARRIATVSESSGRLLAKSVKAPSPPQADEEFDIATHPMFEGCFADVGCGEGEEIFSSLESADIDDAGLAAALGVLPSGYRANVFVFTLTPTEVPIHGSVVEPDNAHGGLTEAIFARDYCVFAPSSCAAEESLANEPEIRAPQSGQLRRWRDAFSMQLARGMRWAGSSMIDWSDALEDRIRVANTESAESFESRQ